MSVAFRYRADGPEGAQSFGAFASRGVLELHLLFQRVETSAPRGLRIRARAGEPRKFDMRDDTHSLKRISGNVLAVHDVALGHGVARETIYLVGIPEHVIDVWLAEAP